jgi:hypothetical protein
MNLRLLNYFVLTILILSYIVFIFARPYEDDESLYILAGKALLQGKLDPFKIVYRGHYSNPFQYIMGSPLATMIYGFGYIIGGIFLSRLFAMIFIVSSLILVHKLTYKIGGNPLISLVFAGFSSSTILLASDSILDSVSLFFFILSLFLITKRKWFFGGISVGLATASKFFASIPVVFILIYLLVKKRNSRKLLLGFIIVLLILTIMYWQLIKTILNFVIVEKINVIDLANLKNLLIYLIYFFPIASIICLLEFKDTAIKKYFIFFIPVIAVLSFHLLTTNYLSLYRQLPFAEFSASILVGRILIKLDKRILSLIITVFLIINLSSASIFVLNYPSYNSIKDKLSDVNGRILALNPHAFILSKDWDIFATEDNVFSYYYFDYKHNLSTNNLKSDIEDYETALKDKFFDFAFISSYSPPEFPRYIQIENSVRKYYCPYLKQNRTNGIDIYKKC